ncbi:MAG: hypothetical protein CR968_04170 [Flavobacteriia bacterium]|nr:MAG: hypothetical protein CR968_04170 [Flavobacteriia bacterium]
MYKQLSIILLAVLLVTACNTKESLQHFMVKQEEQEDVFTFDLSNNFLQLNEEFQTPDNQKILSTIKKINLMAFRLKEGNEEKYTKDVATLRSLLSEEKYSPLMTFGKGSRGVKVYAIGDEDTLDELIVLGNDHETGWLIVRILGDDMQPEKIMSLMGKFDFDKDELPLEDLKAFF